MEERPLAGGIANAGAVVRAGDHVLRPANPYTPSVHRFLTAVHGTGFDGASVPVAVDADGRERLRFIEGDVAVPPFPAWAQTDEALASIAVLLRRFHDASAAVAIEDGSRWSTELADPEGGAIVCHNDVCLENVVFRDGLAVALIDFDFAAPGRPVYDLAQFARMCVPLGDEANLAHLGWVPSDRPARLRLVADAYGLARDERPALLAAIATSIDVAEAFVRGRVARGDANFIAMTAAFGDDDHHARRRRWWEANRDELAAALS